MKYQDIRHFKYRLVEDECMDLSWDLSIHGLEGITINHYLFTLEDGKLTIFAGYLWDGVSGPTYDSENTMLGGLIHDALYQMIRLGLIPHGRTKEFKAFADELFKRIILSYGMSEFRAGYYYLAVDLLGASSCVPGDIRIPKVVEV